MAEGTFGLLARRRFLPLFVTQFLGAANDNFYENAMGLLVIYRLSGAAEGQVLVNVGTGLLMLPYFFFSATAGELADRFEKSWLMKRVKACEIPVALVAGVGLLLGNIPILLAALFLFGVQATFFGPLKYALLPEHLALGELVTGNGLIEGGTFIAILIGTIAGGLLILAGHGILLVAALMLGLALAGFAASLFLPTARRGDRTVRVRPNPWAATLEVLGLLRQTPALWSAVIAISWFWAMGVVLVTEFPAYGKDVIGADQNVVTLFLAMFSIGIGLGSVLCARLLKGRISARHVPVAALGMSLFAADLYWASRGLPPPSASLLTLGGFIARPSSWRILADLVLLSACGGLYTVPLYAILQARAQESQRARVVAANNIMNALFMVAAAGLTALLLAAGLALLQLFLIITVINLVVVFYIWRKAAMRERT